MSGMPEIDLPSATQHGRASGTKDMFKVEVRTSYWSPTQIGDFVVDNVWRTLPITRGAVKWGTNIPIRSWDTDAADHGLFDYKVAIAHLWAFLAFCEAGSLAGALCLEGRLVKVRFHYEYHTEELGVSNAIRHDHNGLTFTARSEAKSVALSQQQEGKDR